MQFPRKVASNMNIAMIKEQGFFQNFITKYEKRDTVNVIGCTYN